MTMRPEDLLEHLTGPAAWIGSNMAANPDRWLYHLTAGEALELIGAARAFRATGREIGQITAAQFPLAEFGTHLRELHETLIHGVGVQVIRGLPLGQLDRWTAAAVFCGIGAHLGQARSQNAAGHVLGHVRDTGADASDPGTRIYQTAARQTFHTDSADAVGLLCLRDARQGGLSLLVSAETLHNRMRAEHPGLLPYLFDPIATDRRGEVPEGAKPYLEIPPFSVNGEKLTVFYQRQYIDSAQRFPGAMRLTPDHVAALDAFDALANDPDLHFGMQLRPGDMQFVYNHAMLHDRTGFLDWPEPTKRRHLLRLWLSLPGDRVLPACFRQRYGSIEIGNRGGIVTSGTRLHAPLD